MSLHPIRRGSRQKVQTDLQIVCRRSLAGSMCRGFFNEFRVGVLARVLISLQSGTPCRTMLRVVTAMPEFAELRDSGMVKKVTRIVRSDQIRKGDIRDLSTEFR